jgi:hypothetical protein
MLFPEHIHPWIYDNVLKFTCDKTVMNSPLFFLPLEHYLIHFVLLSLVHVAPPSVIRTLVAYPFLLYHLYWSPLADISKNADSSTFCHSLITTQIAAMTTTIFLSPPESTGYRLKYKSGVEGCTDDDHDVARFQPYTWNKFLWAFERCFLNMRGVGWNFQMKSVTERPRKGNNVFHFIVSKCIFQEIFLKYWAYDISLFIYDVLMLTPSDVAKQSSFVVLLSDIMNHHWILRLLIQSLSAITIIYYGLNLVYWCGAILSLMVGFSQVEDWPDMFQLGKGGFSMCAFWSTWWHQYLSRDAYILSKTIVDGLDISKRLRRYLLVLGTFMLCGFIHAIASLSLPWDGNTHYNPYVPKWVPNELYLDILDREISPNRCFYSMYLFFHAAHVMFVELAFQKYVLSPLLKHLPLHTRFWTITFRILASLWMLSAHAWPVLMYIQELHHGGFDFPHYMDVFTFTKLIH